VNEVSLLSAGRLSGRPFSCGLFRHVMDAIQEATDCSRATITKVRARAAQRRKEGIGAVGILSAAAREGWQRKAQAQN
jgi:hypothetical protein